MINKKLSMSLTLLLLLYFMNTGAIIYAESASVEITPIEELSKNLIPVQRVVDLAHAYLEDEKQRANSLNRQNPDFLFYSDKMNFLAELEVGLPRLVFQKQGAFCYYVPLEKNGIICGFMGIDCRSGRLNSLPRFREGGEPCVAIAAVQWNQIELNLCTEFGIENPEQGRLILWLDGIYSKLYMAFPGVRDVARIDVTSLGADKYAPGLLNQAPWDLYGDENAASCIVGDDDEDILKPLNMLPEEQSMPDAFSLAVLPVVKDQKNWGSCVGHAASTILDWWQCGSMCYLGKGDSKNQTCKCSKDRSGMCSCIDNIISRQYMYDRGRFRMGFDCRTECPDFCNGRDKGCKESLVTSGVVCGNPCVCEGSCAVRQTMVMVLDGGCTEECQPYGCYSGCSDGGRNVCKGDCPNHQGPCGDDFKLKNYGRIERYNTQEIATALYRRGIVFESGDVCACWFSGGGCLCAPLCECERDGGHAYDFIGYDFEAEPPRFVFQNSWGTSWGSGGRGELSTGFQLTKGGAGYFFEGKSPEDPNFKLERAEVDDPAPGNEDGRADPGETVNFIIATSNIGAESQGVKGILVTPDSLNISITKRTSNFGDIGHNDQRANEKDPFIFSVKTKISPHYAKLKVKYTCTQGYSSWDSVTIMIGRPSVLLVIDDGEEGREKYYTDYLDKKYNKIYDQWDTGLMAKGPGNELLKYATVIWFTGESESFYLSEDTLHVKEFLWQFDSDLFLNGQNIDSVLGNTAFFKKVLLAEPVNQNTYQSVITGEKGDLISWEWAKKYIAMPQKSPSSIKPIRGSDAVFLYTTGEAAGLKYAYYGGRVYFSFAWDRILDTKIREEILSNILYWFSNYTGIKDPGNQDGEEKAGSSGRFCLHQNFPNPCNPGTSIPVFLPEKASLQINIFSVSGELVKPLVQKQCSPGFHVFQWDGKNHSGKPVASGIYLCTAQTEKDTATRKIIILK